MSDGIGHSFPFPGHPLWLDHSAMDVLFHAVGAVTALSFSPFRKFRRRALQASDFLVEPGDRPDTRLAK